MRLSEISRHLGVLGDIFEGTHWHEHDTPDVGRSGQRQGFCLFCIDKLEILQTPIPFPEHRHFRLYWNRVM